MSKLSISNPYPYFTDGFGLPLFNGYLYFGAANTNPEATPVAVYWDAELTIPAAQPIRTINGYPARDGSPAQIYIAASDYSITVRDRWRRIVYTAMSATVRMPAGLVTYNQGSTGAVTQTLEERLQKYVHIDAFGAVGDGVTDDTTPLTNFWNSAIANPGVIHDLASTTYAYSSPMPEINVSNVKIRGQGAEIHDVGQLVTGTVLKWIGASTVGPGVDIKPIEGASNQRIHSILLQGIGFDGNNGALDYLVQLFSIQESVIDIAVVNAGNTGLNLGVVGTLGEARDLQKNWIKVSGRQIESTDAWCVTMGGDSGANVSLNEFIMDCQHSNFAAVNVTNSDNNDWWFFRSSRPLGTATECISLAGGATEPESSRLERFHYLTTDQPIHVYGTSGSPSYAYPSTNHQIFAIDTENGTPVPVVEAGGSIHYRKDVSALSDDPWVAWTPTIAATSGTITTSSASGLYIRRGIIVTYKLQISITTNGTGAGAITFSLPIATTGTVGQSCYGKERAMTGNGILGFVDGGSATTGSIQFYDGTYPGGNGHLIEVSGFYEVT